MGHTQKVMKAAEISRRQSNEWMSLDHIQNISSRKQPKGVYESRTTLKKKKDAKRSRTQPKGVDESCTTLKTRRKKPTHRRKQPEGVDEFRTTLKKKERCQKQPDVAKRNG